MLNFFIYEAKVSLLLAVFYICYRVLLSHETFHRLNRIVLTGSVIVSFLLPFCVLTVHRTVMVPAGTAVYDMPSETTIPPVLPQDPQNLPAFAAETAASAPQSGWLLTILAFIYFAGVAFCFVRIVMELIHVSRIIRSGEILPQQDGLSLVIVDRDLAPFSWMRWTVLSREDYESGNRHIREHERAHIRLGHARDLLVMNVLSAMQWFNPVMRMLKEDLRAIYEYEADDAVLRGGANIREYQYSLIRKAVSASGYSITNSFNHSILKNRITMMSKQKSGTWCGLRALYVLPLIAAALACNTRTVTNYKVSENSQTKGGEMTVPSLEEVNLFVTQAGDHVEYTVNGEKVSLDAIGEKVLEAQGEGFAYVSIIGDPALKSGAIQQVKDELRKVNFLRIQYVSEPNVSVQRKLERTEAKKTLSDLPDIIGDGDVQIRLNDSDRLLYMRGGKDARAVNQEDLFALAKEDVEKNPGIAFFFVIDNNSTYGPYSSAVQSVYNAFITVREDMAVKTYGKPFDELEEAQQDELRDKCYVKITEISK
jgi:biopolymer transport protein ExbD